MNRDNNIIKSTSEDQNEILANILHLYVTKGYFDCDLTTSKGVFYKYGIAKPQHLYDKFPQLEDVKDLEQTKELPNEIFDSIVVDLPFIINESKTTSKGLIEKRFTAFTNQDELYQANNEMLELSYRLLKNNGILVMKTMDFCHSNKQYWMGHYIQTKAQELGFKLADLFILTAKHRMLSKGVKQHHARKYHSYFFVFVKKVNNTSIREAMKISRPLSKIAA